GFRPYALSAPGPAPGSVDPRQVVVPLRPVLKRARLITGEVAAVAHVRRMATINPTADEPFELRYDHVILALGSVSRVLPIPGLRDAAVGVKTVTEAIYLRNQLLSRMDVADSSDDPERRARAPTFVFGGGGYAGVGAAAA